MRDHHSSHIFPHQVASLLEQLEAPNKSVNESAPQSIDMPTPQDIDILLNRITVLENKAAEQQKILKDSTIEHQHILQIPQKLIVIELLRSVLEGLIPIETLKTFLHKISEPWALSLLATLDPIKNTITYPQLEALLVPPPLSFDSLSIWERIKTKLQSLVRIRKLDEHGAYKLKPIESIQKSLEVHDIQQALKFFEMLTPQENAQLSSWKILAQERLTLENSLKNLLLELTESP
ncbi:MAG: hypothetical protein K2W92_00960 [Alphaproteobacteria bacterium]|nr:hypothetical protein [Alphaproteobacteria bacterium]